MAGKGPKPGVLTIYMEKLEILVGKSNGSHDLVWEGSENMGCDLRGCLLSILCSGSYSLHINFYRDIFMHKIWFGKLVSTPGVHLVQLSFVAYFSALSLANSPPRDLQITAYK